MRRVGDFEKTSPITGLHVFRDSGYLTNARNFKVLFFANVKKYFINLLI